uniref:Lysyl-tRNA synthetase (LysK) n=1 Tax=uncultured marine thaumarchaeote SAT1000_06_B02 TaxID=1456361 RepID=A0A075I238_9ARCH|nr:lysyl-tRNA synthetase (lysK) [uncultured marine thaumarchaeote SAT1000_06_B02]
MDGLRKIPEGLDVKEENIGRRVSAIDDPLCDEHDSYGEHMSSLLLDGLNRLGIEYEHKTASQTYKEGLLTEQIHKILVNSKKIGNKIEELTGQQKFQNVLPYFPVCKNCDRLYTTESFEYIEDEKRLGIDVKILKLVLILSRAVGMKERLMLQKILGSWRGRLNLPLDGKPLTYDLKRMEKTLWTR